MFSSVSQCNLLLRSEFRQPCLVHQSLHKICRAKASGTVSVDRRRRKKRRLNASCTSRTTSAVDILGDCDQRCPSRFNPRYAGHGLKKSSKPNDKIRLILECCCRTCQSLHGRAPPDRTPLVDLFADMCLTLRGCEPCGF